MRTRIITYSGLLLLFCLTSCDDFLTEELQGDYSTETFYKNQSQAIGAINGVYNALTFTTSNNAIWVFGDVASDDAVKGGNAGDQAEIEYIDKFTADHNNGIIENYWSFVYEAIARANNVIANVPSVDMDENLRNRIVGEAKFIRAYCYFNLVNIFGEVPLKLLPQTTSEAIQVPLSSVETIYSQIETDLNDAIKVLPATYSSSEAGRATQGAALGLLGKAQIYEEKWSEAINSFHALEDLNIYSLLSNYGNLFDDHHKNSSESLFEIQHLTGQTPGMGSSLNQWFAPAGENGYYFNAPTQSLVSEYEETSGGQFDPRLDYTIGRDGQPWLNNDTFSVSWSPTGYLTKKHQQPLSEVSTAMKGDGDLNYIYLRYADVLLMKAEAFVHLNQPDSALANLNRVRERARNSFSGTPPANLLPDITTKDQSALLTAIRHERRVELAQEFHRYFDLMRWGKSIAESALGSGFNFENNRYFPLPQSELDANKAIQK